MLIRDDVPVSLKEWATSVFDAMRPVAAVLDKANGNDDYSNSLELFCQRIGDFSRTPSARILQSMREHGEEYYHFARRMALQHQEYFHERELSAEKLEYFQQLANESIARQQQIENNDDLSFNDFLAQYYVMS